VAEEAVVPAASPAADDADDGSSPE
jgi:hypothetical protein